MHKVTCVYCRQTFDRDKEPFVQISERRYAHQACAEKIQREKTQEEKDFESLLSYIHLLLKENYVEARIIKQIKTFRETYQYTYSGMIGTLAYWYEIKGNPIDKANGGIGIIPYIYLEAKNYYEKMNAATNINNNIYNYKAQMRIIEIDAPQPQSQQPRLFKLEEEDN